MRTPEEEELFKQRLLGLWDLQNAWRLNETNQQAMLPEQKEAYLSRRDPPKMNPIAEALRKL